MYDQASTKSVAAKSAGAKTARRARRRIASAASTLLLAGTGLGIIQALPAQDPAGASTTSSNVQSASARIARAVEPGLVDINTNLGYQNESAAGTGMVLTANGLVLTNNHVINGATSIRVTDVGNGRTYVATVLGYDKTHDVAVLQLKNASGLTTVRLGDSSKVRTGDAVVAVGNAGGVGGVPSFAGGSITARNQSIVASDETASSSETLTKLFGTDADVQPGDSGGPLVNANGQVIGMDTAGSSGTFTTGFGTSANSTQAYAIPINDALGIARQIVTGKSSVTVHIGATPFLGVQVQTVTASGGGNFGIGFGFALPGGSVAGAAIAQLLPSSPAAAAGLSAGDVITALNHKSVTSTTSLSQILTNVRAGSSVPVTYVDEGGTRHTTTVRLASGPPQ